MISKPSPLLNQFEILYIEDDQKVISMMKERLEPHCKTLTIVKNGQEALDAFIEKPASIVITDINLPEISGTEITHYIKEYDSSIPVLITAAQEETHLLADAIDAGVDAFLTKPVDETKLFDHLNRVSKNLTEFGQQQLILDKMQMLLDHQDQPVMLATNGKIEFANQKIMRIFSVLSIEDLNEMPAMNESFSQESKVMILDAMKLESENWVEGLLKLAAKNKTTYVEGEEKTFEVEVINSDDNLHQIIKLNEN